MSQGHTDGKPAMDHYPVMCAKYKKDYETARKNWSNQVGFCTEIATHDACMDTVDQCRAEMKTARKKSKQFGCQELS